MTKVTVPTGPYDPEYVKSYVRQMLKGTIFMGSFQEKRYVASLNAYRDVITISREEEEFIKNLLIVKKRLQECFLKIPWIGITEPDTIGAPVGYSLWVELPLEITGNYWYKVRRLEILENEIRLKLDCLRPIKTERCAALQENNSPAEINLSNIVKDLQYRFKVHMCYIYKEVLTIENIKQAVIFLVALLTVSVGSCISAIQYLLEYWLRFMREFSNLVKVVTPLFTSTLNFFGKLIFGFYHMVVAIFHGKPKQQPIYNNFLTVDPSQFNSARYNQYYNGGSTPYQRRSITITPYNN